MRRLLILVALVACSLSLPLVARERIFGECMKGGQQVRTVGILSTSLVLASYPSCTVTVFNTGTLTLATIFSDNSGTAKSNPFTADAFGYWFFYPDNGRYDVQLSGGGLTGTYTFPDVLANDGGGGGGGGGGITSINALTGPALTIASGTSGTNFNIGATGSTITINCPTASASFRGCLSSADWSTFNSKQSAISVNSPLTLVGATIGLTSPLGTSFGGTGATSPSGAIANLSPLTTKGDIFVFGSANTRLNVGTDGQCLTADSTTGFGLRWAACPGGGGGGTFPQILTAYTQTSSSSTVTTTNVLSSTPAGYYEIKIYAETASSGTGNIVVTLGWTSAGGAKTTQIPATLSLTSNASAAASIFLNLTGSTNVTIAIAYTSTGTYNLTLLPIRWQ